MGLSRGLDPEPRKHETSVYQTQVLSVNYGSANLGYIGLGLQVKWNIDVISVKCYL